MTDKYEALKSAALAAQGAGQHSSRYTKFGYLVSPDVVLVLIAERDALAAKLAQMEAQEPIAMVADLNNRLMFSLEVGGGIPRNSHLYLAPGANPDAKDAARYRWLRSVGGGGWTVTNPPPERRAKYEFFDAAVDAAIGAQK